MRNTPHWPSSDAFELSVVPLDDYVREVLPHSNTLWAGRRSFDQYVGEWRATALSGYGRRRVRTYGVRLNGAIVASFKRYDRDVIIDGVALRAAGIGAVFTPEALRGRGYATAMLGAALDTFRAEGVYVAYLFSDIHPAFYEKLGFVELPSRTFSTRVDALPDSRIGVTTLDADDAAAIARCFGAVDDARIVRLRRSPLVWSWFRLRAISREHSGDPIVLGVRRGRTLAAYVAGRRVVASDAFVLEELAFTDPGESGLALPLLRAAAGDLRRITGWLPPSPVRDALPQSAVRRRTSAIAMLAPLSREARNAWKGAIATVEATRGDAIWSADQI